MEDVITSESNATRKKFETNVLNTESEILSNQNLSNDIKNQSNRLDRIRKQVSFFQNNGGLN